MFAFVLYDQKNNTLWVARDRFGIKPLYYSAYKNNFYFCSEIKPITKIIENLTIDRAAVSDYISMGYIKNPNSIYHEIKKLEPGTYLDICIKTKKISKIKWYSLSPSLKKFKDNREVIELVEEQIKKSLNNIFNPVS